MEDIARLVKEAMAEQQMSVRDVEAASERHGARVSYSTVSRITKGTYRPGEKVLRGLSGALNIPIERLRAAARISDPGRPFKLPDYASRLSASERSAVEHLVRVMVDAKDERQPAEPDEDEEDYELAASHGDEGIAPDEDPHTT